MRELITRGSRHEPAHGRPCFWYPVFRLHTRVMPWCVRIARSSRYF